MAKPRGPAETGEQAGSQVILGSLRTAGRAL
jgi:hypothetical protein